MILYHQTANEFAKFDLSKAWLGPLGAGIYFCGKKPTEDGAHGVVCDVQILNPLVCGDDFRRVSDEKWGKMAGVIKELIFHGCGKEVSIPPCRGDETKYFQILCDIYAKYVDAPDWPKFLSEFHRITGCDGIIRSNFVICFDPDKIAIFDEFGESERKGKIPPVQFSYTKIREMVYGENPNKTTILSYGCIDERWFVIANNHGKYPMAYVEAKPGDPNLFCDYENYEDCEIGYVDTTSITEINFGPEEIFHLGTDRENLAFDILSKKFWGWTYSSSNDYSMIISPLGLDIDEGKRHSEMEILQEDVIPFIRWVNGVGKKRN